MYAETIYTGCCVGAIGLILFLMLLGKLSDIQHYKNIEWLRDRGWDVSTWRVQDGWMTGCRKSNVYFGVPSRPNEFGYPREPVMLAMNYEKKHGYNSEARARLNREKERLKDEAFSIRNSNRYRVRGTGLKPIDNGEFERIMKRVEEIDEELRAMKKFK